MRNKFFTIFSLVVIVLTYRSDELEFKYHTNSEMEDVLRSFASENPHESLRTRLYPIGKTAGGNQLWVLSMTAAEEDRVGVPNIKLIGNMHGNEAVGREILLHFIEHLIENYTKDDAITWLLNNTKIHILPSLNPDGFDIASNNIQDKCTGIIGRNIPIHDVDLNRNFPCYFYNNSKMITWNITESNSIRHWMENTTFVLSAALHGGALVANYPYDLHRNSKSTSDKEPSVTPDDDVFRHLANTYAKNHPTMYLGEPCSGSGESFEGGIVNGAMWYELEGGMGDYNYAFHGCMEVTLEMSCCKYPDAKELPTFWEHNRKPLLKYCQQVHTGVTGQILDAKTEETIKSANLSIIGRDIIFRSTKDIGEFWRILLPGKYKLKVEANDYFTQIISFEVLDYKDNFPKLTFLKIELLNSTDPTTTTPITTTDYTSTRTPYPYVISFNLTERFGKDWVDSPLETTDSGSKRTQFSKSFSIIIFAVAWKFYY